MRVRVDIRNSEKINTDIALFLSFTYNTDLLNYIRECPVRSWHSDNKEWELDTKYLAKILNKFPNFEYEITSDTELLKPKKKLISVDGFSFKTKPFDHQIDGFEYGLNHDKWLLGDEQGLGKTKVVIDIAVAKKHLKGYKHCLIVCGVNGLKWNWLKEISTHSNESGYILGQRFKNGKLTIGSSTDKLNDCKSLADNTNYFIITNVESLRNVDIRAKLSALCKSGEIGIVAIDEAHKCFDYDTLIDTNLGKLKIGDIVTNRIECNVLSYNEHTQLFENKRITNFYENAIFDEMLELDIETTQGIKTIVCTKNHMFYTTNRGWVEADDLTCEDDILEYLDNSCIYAL